MRARNFAFKSAFALLATASIMSHSSAKAEGWDLKFTEASEPDATPWTDPAVLSAKINNKGPDSFVAHVNAEFTNTLSPMGFAIPAIGGRIAWDRSTDAGDKQNNLEVGAQASYDYIGDLSSAPKEGLLWTYSSKLDLGYARTASYPDVTQSPCVTAPSNPACKTQFKESFRGVASISPFERSWEGSLGGSDSVYFSFRPKFETSYDLLLNNTQDFSTGNKIKGGYLSGAVGAGISVSPTFINPAIMFNATGLLRQRLAVSDSRRSEIERSAGLLKVSLDYYVIRPKGGEETGWRAAIGLTYTEGSDPLTGKPKQSTILLALKVGRF